MVCNHSTGFTWEGGEEEKKMGRGGKGYDMKRMETNEKGRVDCLR